MTALGLLSLADHLPDPVSGRTTSQAERFRLIVESAVLAESAGFGHLGLGEHHFGNYILPSPPLLLATIAGKTHKIRLGTSVTLLANLDPLRVAEDLLTLDVLSNGRAEMTVARGVMVSAHVEAHVGVVVEAGPRAFAGRRRPADRVSSRRSSADAALVAMGARAALA